METPADRTSRALSGGATQQLRALEAARCPICKRDETIEFFRVDRVPVFCNVLFDSPEGAARASRGLVHLRFCQLCGYIYNSAFAPELVAYAPGYENALHFSPRFRRYARRLAQRLIERLDLRGGRIIEIGCGDGYFLRMLCRMGPNTGVGFDPSHDIDEEPEIPTARVSFRRECYTPDHADEKADLICCRHVLEHIPSPLVLLSELRRTIGPHQDVWVFFEVPNALYMLRGFGLWDVLYEHCSYFLGPALKESFVRAGFEPVSSWEGYRGQFLSLLARPVSPKHSPPTPHRPVPQEVRRCVENFAGRFERKVDYWDGRLTKFRHQGKRVVFWGAGSKGVTLLNTLEHSRELVPYIVDVSPRKQGKFIPGAGQQIVAAGFLRQNPPDVVVIMNPIYSEEIQRTLRKLDVHAQVLVA